MNEMIMVSHSLNNNTLTGLVIALCLNTFGQSDPPELPQILLSCGTIVGISSFSSVRNKPNLASLDSIRLSFRLWRRNQTLSPKYWHWGQGQRPIIPAFFSQNKWVTKGLMIPLSYSENPI